MPWHILFHIVAALVSRQRKKAAAARGSPALPRKPRDREEGRRWAEQAVRRDRLVNGAVFAEVAHIVLLIVWALTIPGPAGRVVPGPSLAQALPAACQAGAVAAGVLGCVLLARARGRDGMWGLFGLLSLPGLGILLLVPRRCGDCGGRVGSGERRCPKCLRPI